MWSGSGRAQTNPGDIYIIGAHLDDMPSSGAAPGADDNASGSVATLIAADIMSQYEWGCTLRFAFWTGEEQGMLGSSVYAARSKTTGETVKGYLNLDMVAYNAVAPRELNLFWKSTVPASQNIADLFVDVVSAYGLDLVPFKYDARSYTIGNQSDNKSFWDQGYPSILAIEDYYGDFTPYYHKSTDTLSTLDMGYFTTMVQAAVGTFAHMTGCLIPGSTAVTLTDFSATPVQGGSEITRQTVSEFGSLGFNPHRGLTADHPDQVLSYMPSKVPGSIERATHDYSDQHVSAGHTYWLEDLHGDDTKTMHGPLDATFSALNDVALGGPAASERSLVQRISKDWPGIAVVALVFGVLLWARFHRFKGSGLR